MIHFYVTSGSCQDLEGGEQGNISQKVKRKLVIQNEECTIPCSTSVNNVIYWVDVILSGTSVNNVIYWVDVILSGTSVNNIIYWVDVILSGTSVNNIIYWVDVILSVPLLTMLYTE
jgi:hypothetical protein